VRQKNELAEVLGLAPDLLRVLSYDVGGNFGTRNRVFVEFGLYISIRPPANCCRAR
jgi:aerobic carbon-monoxide dehydrogenase large subunit